MEWDKMWRNAIRWDKIRLGPISSHPIRPNPIQSDPIRYHSMLCDSMLCDSILCISQSVWSVRCDERSRCFVDCCRVQLLYAGHSHQSLPNDQVSDQCSWHTTWLDSFQFCLELLVLDLHACKQTTIRLAAEKQQIATSCLCPMLAHLSLSLCVAHQRTDCI